MADIRLIRANARVQDNTTQALNERVMRERMLADGDITRPQFELLELESGRLPNGLGVLTLFYQKNSEYGTLLDLGVADPLRVELNNPDEMLERIAERKSKAMEMLANAISPSSTWRALVAKKALETLEARYRNPGASQELQELPPKPTDAQGGNGKYIDPRVRAQDLANFTPRDITGDDRYDWETPPEEEPM